MSLKKICLGILVTSAFSLSACSERTEVYEEKTTPVVVPDSDKDVDVNVRTEQQPANNTTTTESTETTTTQDGQVTTQSRTQTTN